MNKFTRLLTVLGSALLLTVAARAGEAAWQTDFAAASKQAAAENKVMLLDFTGSDWCPWCIKLDQEVYTQPKFLDYAAQNLVLVKLDFPRRTPQADVLKAQNKALAEKYGIEGFPTTVVLNSKGEKIGQYEGYMEGGPVAYLGWLKGLK